MIIKSFELQKIKSSNSSIILIYGNNEGLKEQIINDCFIKDFKGEIILAELGDLSELDAKADAVDNQLQGDIKDDEYRQ